MTEFKPFADDSAVLTIDGMAIENDTQVVIVHGSLDIRRDKAGLADAKAMRAALDDIVRTLEEDDDLPEELELPDNDVGTFDPPFGGGR